MDSIQNLEVSLNNEIDFEWQIIWAQRDLIACWGKRLHFIEEIDV